MSLQKLIVIIGSGPTGLGAAHRLSELGYVATDEGWLYLAGYWTFTAAGSRAGP